MRMLARKCATPSSRRLMVGRSAVPRTQSSPPADDRGSRSGLERVAASLSRKREGQAACFSRARFAKSVSLRVTPTRNGQQRNVLDAAVFRELPAGAGCSSST